LENSKPSKEALEEYGEKLDKQWNKRRVHGPLTYSTTALHTAAAEDNAHIIGFILDSLKSGEHSNALMKMLLATDNLERTAWHMAAKNGSVQAIERIWDWAEEVTHTLLSQDNESTTAEGGHIKVVEKTRN
jgi:hypothetical protein